MGASIGEAKCFAIWQALSSSFGRAKCLTISKPKVSCHLINPQSFFRLSHVFFTIIQVKLVTIRCSKCYAIWWSLSLWLLSGVPRVLSSDKPSVVLPMVEPSVLPSDEPSVLPSDEISVLLSDQPSVLPSLWRAFRSSLGRALVERTYVDLSIGGLWCQPLTFWFYLLLRWIVMQKGCVHWQHPPPYVGGAELQSTWDDLG